MSNNPAFDRQHEIASAMKGIDFPVDRDALLEHARSSGASRDVLDRLGRLRDGDFDNVAQVMDATNE